MTESDPAARWRPLFEADLLEPGTPQRVVVEGLPALALFRLDDGSCHVTADACTHGDASLSEGFVEGDEIECPWHGGRFCVRDGKATAPPAAFALRTWPVRVVDGQVCIDVAAGAEGEGR